MKAFTAFLAVILLFLTLAGIRPASAQATIENIDFFTTNVVSTRFGHEGPDDGVRHLARQPDGRTTLEELEGVPCRYHNRAADGKTFGFLYFNIHPDFKERALTNARIDVEYLVPKDTLLRLQYDAIVEGERKPYKGATAQKGARTKLAPTAEYTRIRGTNVWQKATFHIADGAFKNSQNGKADFRLEVTPAEIYVRRVTLTREEPLNLPVREAVNERDQNQSISAHENHPMAIATNPHSGLSRRDVDDNEQFHLLLNIPIRQQFHVLRSAARFSDECSVSVTLASRNRRLACRRTSGPR